FPTRRSSDLGVSAVRAAPGRFGGMSSTESGAAGDTTSLGTTVTGADADGAANGAEIVVAPNAAMGDVVKDAADGGGETVRVRMDVSYDGTDFHGWAAQKGGLRTVQGVLEEKLALVCRTPVELTVAGRTDAVFHADGQVCHSVIPAEAFTQR